MEQRRGLGRGIASLISNPLRSAPPSPVVVESTNKLPYRVVPIGEIVPNPSQPRKFFDQAKIQELSASIKEKGILAPLIVLKEGEGRPDSGKYQLISGERRYRAAQLAGLAEVPVYIREAQAGEAMEIALIENVQRQDLDPIEEAAAYQELMDKFYYTQEEVATKVSKDRTTVANMLRLLKLPTKVKQALQTGQISTGHARTLLSLPEIERQIYFADKVVEEGWSVRELESRIAAKRAIGLMQKVRRGVPALSTNLLQLVDDIRRVLGTQVKLIPKGKKGKIIIEYYSDEDLNRVHKLLVK